MIPVPPAGPVVSLLPRSAGHSSPGDLPDYRRDIDGLRALAVLAVVGFHAFPEVFAGGFVGVDLFFVISGYLISTIIYRQLEAGTFSLAGFYARRIRRIFPALVVVLAVTLGLGWFVLLADEYRQLGRHVVAGAAFASNFLLWRESGYFAPAAETLPLLHLWSLGIEEQFYLAWPLVLYLAWKTRADPLRIVLVLAVASFSWNTAMYRIDSVAAFYSPLTRAWELLAGAMLARLSLNRPALVIGLGHWPSRSPDTRGGALSLGPAGDTQSLAGAGMILVGLVVLNEGRSFPGYWALLPVTGALLVIASGPGARFNRTILSNRLLVSVGRISYPLYLWHWPLLALANLVEGGEPGVWLRAAAVLLAVVLAWATFVWIEAPLRFGRHGRAKVAALALAMAVVGVAGFVTARSDGAWFGTRERSEFLEHFENSRPAMRYFERIGFFGSWRLECAYFDYSRHRRNELAGSVRDSRARPSLDPSCYQRDPSRSHAVMLWGDSHAMQLAPGLARHLPESWQLLQVASFGCPPEIDTGNASSLSQCDQSNRKARQTIREALPEVVVIARMRGHALDEMAATASALRRDGVRRVVFVGPVPRWTLDLPRLIARKLWNGPRRTRIGLDTEVQRIDARLAAGFKPDSGRRYASLIDLFCDAEGCLTYLGEDRRTGITTWDYGHLTPVASDFVARRLLVDLIISTPLDDEP